MKSELDVPRLGEFIRARRAAVSVSLEGLAEQTGLSGGYVSKLERGLIESPDIRYLARIGDALGVSVGELLTEAGLAGAEVLPDVAYYLKTKLGLPDKAIPAAVEHLADLQRSAGRRRRTKKQEKKQ